jgi:hypothetical protein
MRKDNGPKAEREARIRDESQGMIQQRKQLAEQRQDANAHDDFRDYDRDVEGDLGKLFQFEFEALKRQGRHSSYDGRNECGRKSDGQCIPGGISHVAILGQFTKPVKRAAWTLHDVPADNLQASERGNKAFKSHIRFGSIERINYQYKDRCIKEKKHQDRGKGDERGSAMRVHAATISSPKPNLRV